MSLADYLPKYVPGRFPRTRGDEPVLLADAESPSRFSPHARG